MGLKKEKRKPEFKKGSLVEYNNVTHVVSDIKFDSEADDFIYRIKIPGNLFAFWTSGKNLYDKRISDAVTLKNFFKSLGQ